MPLEDMVYKITRSSSVPLATFHKEIRNTNLQKEKCLTFQYHKTNFYIDKREDRS